MSPKPETPQKKRQFFRKWRLRLRFCRKKASSADYRILRIMPDQETLYLIKKGSKVPEVLTLQELASNIPLLNRLSTKESAYLGLRYAQYWLRDLGHNGQSGVIPNSSHQKKARYQLQCASDGEHVFYLDKKRGRHHLADPSLLVQRDELLQRFSASAAFCIGLLAEKQRYLREQQESLSEIAPTILRKKLIAALKES